MAKEELKAKNLVARDDFEQGYIDAWKDGRFSYWIVRRAIQIHRSRA